MKKQWNDPIVSDLGVESTEKNTYPGTKIDLWEPAPEGDHDNVWYES